MQMRDLRRILGVLAATAVIATGCAGESPNDVDEPAAEATDGQEDSETDGEASGEPQVGGTLVAAVAEDLDSTDPHRTSGETGPVWLSLMFETLVFVDGDAQVAPGLAADWEISDDGLTYTFNLRDDIVFHNGRELTAEDVKWNYERIQDPDVGAASAAVFGIVESIETPDEHTLVMELNTPSGALLSDLALQGRVGIVAPESYDDAGEMSEFIGTGPYTYGTYTVNDRLVLERNPDYWGGAPNVETIEVRILPDGSSRLSALAAGEVDFAWNVPAEQASAMEEDANFTLQPFPQNRGNYFAINPETEPFDDARVREAMHLAVSRDDLASTAWSGFAIPNDQPFEPSSFWYVERDTRTEADLARAQELMDEAGVDSASVTISSWDAMGSDQEAQLIASSWEQIGISTSIEVVDIGTIVERGGSGNFDVLHLWVGLNLDPNRPYSFWEADSPRNPVVGNFSTPELDATVKEARATTDQDERKELYAEAIEINEAEAGTFYTVSPQQFVGIGNRLQGYEQGAFYVWYEGGGMTNAWIEE